MTEDNNIWENKGKSFETNPEKVQLKNSPFEIDIRRILAVWPFILLFGLLGYAVGNIYLRYSNITFTVVTTVSMEENQPLSLGQAIIGNPRDPFNDRISYFKSPTLAAQLVDSLGLEYNSEAQGRFRNKSFYKIIKWHIVKNKADETPVINFSIIPQKNGFHFISGLVSGDANWNQPFMINSNKIIVEKLQEFSTNSPIYCYSMNNMAVAFMLSKKIEITSGKESNIIGVQYSDVSSDRAIDILNGLVGLFNYTLEREKSQGLSQSIQFIEQRMYPLRRELDSIENSLAAFKSSQGIVGESTNSQMYLSDIQTYDKELTKINILESTIKAVENFISNPSIKDADLSFVGIETPGLQAVLSQYQQMRLQREKISLTAQETNPTLMLIDRNLADLKSNMEKQLANYKANLRIAQNTYQQKMNSASSYLKTAPNSEKILMDKTRFQNIKEALYTTLLQKREEAAIAKASITVNTKVLSPPLMFNAILNPSKVKILTTAIFIGLLIPILFAFFKEIINRKIISKKQLQGLTKIPVLSELEQAASAENFPFVIEGNNRSMFGEQIRSLRTSISFYLDANKKCNYILLTSSMSGEGKSFISMNLAKSYSLQGKKVALVEFDLRRPKIAKALGLSDEKVGLTSLLLGKNTPDEIVISISNKEDETLDLFPCGTVPPNPQELISTEYMQILKNYLDENYDLVVIDSPPFGIVADAQILGKWADLTLVITRFQQTIKDQIQEINEWNNKGLFKSIAIVFNGVKNSGYFGYKYGYYYYKRKYGYNYYSSNVSDKKD